MDLKSKFITQHQLTTWSCFRRGKPQVLVHVSTYGSILVPVFEPQPNRPGQPEVGELLAWFPLVSPML